jgi:HlyD family secretion protein
MTQMPTINDSTLPWWRSPRSRWIGLAILVAGVLTYCVAAGRGDEPIAYRTTPVERGDVVAKVSATGSLSALVTVEVGSQVSGRVQSLYADFNSVVKKGQLIAKIDPALFMATVAQARANLLAAEASLERAQVQADEARRQATRARQLFDQKLVSENDRDAAETNARASAASVSQARAEVERARSSLSQAQTNLKYTDIVAPTDGIVISRAVNVGQTVAASLQAPILFTIAQDLREMQVNTSVSESDIGRLQAGMATTFTVDAYPGTSFEGRIREIRNAAQVVQNVVTYDAVIDVSNAELKLKPGMTASVTVVTDRRTDVLRVPNAALRFQPPQPDADGKRAGSANATGGRQRPGGGANKRGDAERAVWVLRGKEPVRVPVTTGLTDGTNTEILSGDLQPGDAVVTAITGGAPQQSTRMMGPRIL